MSIWASEASSGPTVRETGEFGLIDALRGALPPAAVANERVPVGIGDDAAVWRPKPGEAVVVTTDSLVEEVHFRLDWTDPASLGHKILAANLSDMAAMGAVPRLAVVALGLRGDERLDDLLALYRGLGSLAERAGVVVAGGDVVRSPAALLFHVTVVGETRGGRYLSRGGARPGDLLAVSGTLGASAAGYRILRDGEGSPRRAAATAELLVTSHLRPEPRLALGRFLLDAGASACMDLSDGLLGDLPKILAASGVSARLDAARLPVSAAVRALFPDEWLDLALRGGEDYELLFTAPPDHVREIADGAAGIGATVTTIGEIVEETGDPVITLRGLDGRETVARPGAFDHFAG